MIILSVKTKKTWEPTVVIKFCFSLDIELLIYTAVITIFVNSFMRINTTEPLFFLSDWLFD